MSRTHPLWPDYKRPQSTPKSYSSLPAESASSPSTFSSQHAAIPTVSTSSGNSSGNNQSTPSSPSLHAFHSASSSSSTYTAPNELLPPSNQRRPKRASLDRFRLAPAPAAPPAAPPAAQTAALSRSASALASASAPLVPQRPPTQSAHSALPLQSPKQHSTEVQHFLFSSSSAAAIPLVSRLPSSSSAVNPTSSETDATAHNHGALRFTPAQAHTTDHPPSSYTRAQLPSSSSISSSSSRNLHYQALSNSPAVSHSSPSSRSTIPIPSSSSLTFNSATSSRAHTFGSASPTAADMPYNIATFEPTFSSSFSFSRRNGSFARLRSGSESIYGASRAATVGDAEVSINVFVWWPSTSKSASSTLARAPLFRDAANVKSKLSMRSASSQPRASESSHEPVFERASFGFRNGGTSWLREKPSKARLNSPSSSVGLLGQWKRAILRFRENGSLSIFGEGNALTHTLHCAALSASDVKCVDDSLFSRPHVLSIQPRQTRGKTEVSITTRKQGAALLQERTRGSDPIFVEFKSEEHRQYMRALLRIYAKPEIYGSPATVDRGGTHRLFRQLDITISDAKSIMPRWPAEHTDATPEIPATPPTSFSTYPLTHSHHPASPMSATAGAIPYEIPRSLSHQLTSLRYDDQDDSPGSEGLTEDALSGSSRAGSRPGSRPGSRLRHNAKPSVSSIRAHHYMDENAGSGSSRPASRAASHYDSQSQAGDDASSNSEHISGPLSGQSGASRFINIPSAVSETAPSISASVGATSIHTAASRASVQRRDDKDRFEKARFDRFCRIRLDGELVARTSQSNACTNAFAVDKFQLKDINDAKSLVIEVLHPTQKTGSSLAGSPSQSAVKYILLGLVEIPIETLRRNEDVEGRFPIWSASTFPSSPTTPEEEEGKIPTGFYRGVVGELNLSIRLQEGAVMPLSMYEEVYRRIHDTDAAEMVRELATTMREDLIISHLIRIYAASGTVAERISSLIESESVTWGEKMEPELLFRANTLLSRSVDHFQRLLALSWLDDCLGPTVRKICQDPNAPSRPDTAMSGSSTGSGGGEDGHFDFSTSIRSPPLLPSNAIDAIPDGPMTTNSLRKLSETMWQNIYRQRHSCPPDLRTVLHQIRRRVNERYRSSKSTRPGIQGVGAFVFLRLFCAALNAPQLYGLTPSQPGRIASRKLLLLSKVLLALASKKTAFDKDKDWELVPLNDLLRTYSSAYDDYISVVSTEPPTAAPVQLLGVRVEEDDDLQAAVLRKLSSLSPIHREAVPRAPYMLDQPQALASFVGFVADAAQEREEAVFYHDTPNTTPLSEGQQDDSAAASSASEGESSKTQSDADRIRRKAHEFVHICCRIEEAAGMCIEQAGYNPRPIPFERLQRAAMPNSSRDDGAVPANSLDSSFLRAAGGDASVASFSSSTSSIGTVIVAGDTGGSSPRSSPGRTRNRRATVSAANARSKMAGSMDTYGNSFERNGSPLDGASPRGARRQSLGLPRSGRWSSQAMSDARIPGCSNGGGEISAPPAGRRMSDASTMTSSQPTSTRVREPIPATPYPDTFNFDREDEDDHGSDDELRQAYRSLRAEEAAAVASATRVAPSSGIAAGWLASTEEPFSTPVEASETQSAPGSGPMRSLLEADDGSAFAPVYPQCSFAPPASSGPPLSRSARQSAELARPTTQQPMFAMSPAISGHRDGHAANEKSSAEQRHEAQLASRRLGSRASFTAAPRKQYGAATSTNETSSQAETSRRHSSDRPIVPRNYSLPQTLADRKNNTRNERRDSSDGFESVLEDAYAQTRASLPPSTSMPAIKSSAAATAERHDVGAGSGAETGQGKKKKWWKP